MNPPTNQAVQQQVQRTDSARDIDPNVQQNKASSPESSVWVTASAGTGKTKVLTDRILRLLLPGADGRPGTKANKILCLTFTKAGAGEMSQRVAKTLARWAVMDEARLRADLKKLQNREPDFKEIRKARQLFAEVADTPGGLNIMTIHSFCQSVLGRFPLEAGIPPHFKTLQENDAALLLEQARDRILQKAERENGSPLANALNRISHAINEEQFFSLIKNIGKEREQMHRAFAELGGADGMYRSICELLGVPPGLEPVDMLKDACDSNQFDESGLRDSCRALSEHGTDSDGGTVSIISAWLDSATRPELFEAYKLAYLKKTGGEIKKKLAGVAVDRAAPGTSAILQKEAWRVFNLIDHMNAAGSALLTRDLFILGHAIVAEYQELKRERAVLDFDDLIFTTCALLEGRAQNLKGDNAATWVLFKLDQELEHILVDEAQDTNPEQWMVVKALAHEFTAGLGATEAERTIFVVGDEKQSIYSFQRASPREFQNTRLWLKQKIEEAGKIWNDVPMNISFRSVKPVLQVVDAVFAAPDMQSGVSEVPVSHTSFRHGQAGLVELWPLVETDDKNEPEPWAMPTEIIEGRDGPSKLAAHIAENIRGWLDDGKNILPARGRRVKAGDIMILFRTRNKLFKLVARALREKKIPVSGADRMVLGEQIAVMDLLAAAEFALQPFDDLNLACLLKSPLVGMDEDTLFHLAHPRRSSLWTELQQKHGDIADYLKDLRGASAQSPFDFFTWILQNKCPADKRSGLRALQTRLGADSQDPIDELLNAALDFETNNVPSLQNFVHVFTRGSIEIKRDMEEGGNFVRLMTVHGAKGLQAPIVIIPDTTRTQRGSPSQADRRLLWPGKTGYENRPLWSPRKEEGYARYNDALAGIDARQENEYRRLLYVAMTRAEDRLYLAGASTARPPLPDSWYFALRAGMTSIPETENIDGILRLTNRQAEGMKPDRPDKETARQRTKDKLPAWLLKPASGEAPPPKPFRPSITDDEPAVLSPLQKDDRKRFLRGNLTHKLLEVLPSLDAAKRETAAKEFLTRYAPDIDAGTRASIIKETITVLNHPQFAKVFGPGSLAEISVAGTLEDGRIVSGQIDRLLITPTEILIIDYKTNRPPPKRTEDVPAIYRAQMRGYAEALTQIYPGRTISCALLWTDGPALMPLLPT